MEPIRKIITRQDCYFKLNEGNSGETSINLSNEIFELVRPREMKRGENETVEFLLYRDDFVKALCYIIDKLPLYKSTSKSSELVEFSHELFRQRLKEITDLFGADDSQTYIVNLLYREDGRIYLNDLKYNGFNLRDFLIENNSTLLFSVEEGTNIIRLISGDTSTATITTTTSPRLDRIEILRETSAATFLRNAISYTLAKDTNMSSLMNRDSINETSKILKVTTFNLGRNVVYLPTRTSDYDDKISWVKGGNSYYLNLEVTPDGIKKFLFPEYNEAYKDVFEMVEEEGSYVLYEYVAASADTEDNERTLSYLTALRAKPFMLLAGISGTGKSRIVRKLAQASVTEDLQTIYDPKSIEKGFNRWQIHKPANFELIQVKPNWHNSLEVVGYKSNIGGAHYEFTPFVEFVVRAWKHQDVPFFLCLDEMNLAPVEQYFAEFLSAIESRSFENDEYETDPIVKPFIEFGDVVCDQMIDHLIGKIVASKAVPDSLELKLIDRFKNKGLTLPKNLFILGTVNMDETTFSFSRKVLDRAMSVVMNDVFYDDFFDGKTEDDVKEMSVDVKKYLIDRPIRGLDAPDNHADVVKSYLSGINGILDNTPFKLGYRAANEALLYISAAFTFNSGTAVNKALDDFTLMKILSRIEGDKRSIGDLLDKLGTVITIDYPNSYDKLNKMAETLRSKQFVSYWT